MAQFVKTDSGKRLTKLITKGYIGQYRQGPNKAPL